MEDIFVCLKKLMWALASLSLKEEKDIFVESSLCYVFCNRPDQTDNLKIRRFT
jgi:hypothetical protein